MGRIEEIETRLSAIKAEIEKEDADVTALSAETDALLEERKGILVAIETRKSTLQAIADGKLGEGEKVTMDNETRSFGVDSPEYRSAFLKSIRNMELTEVEKRANTAINTGSSSAGSAIPTQTINKIIEKVKEYAPLLDKIDLLAIPGGVVVPAEGTTTDAAIHTEGAVITGDQDTLGKVELGAYEITKLVTISKSVEKMTIDAFETYLVKKISRKVADKITGLIINGTGTKQAEGINTIRWDENNSVTVAKDASLTETNLDTAVGLLGGGYDAGAEWVMSKKTFFSDFRPIQNKSKNDVITKDGGTWYVEGYPVSFDERVTLHEAFLGNFELGYIGNMPEEANVTSQFVARENAYDFLGAAMFDGKVSAVEAFVKIIKAAA